MQSQSFRARKLGLTTSHGVPSTTWMPTWQHFSKVRLKACVEGWVEQKARHNSQHDCHEDIFALNNQDLTLMIVNHSLMVS